MSIRVGPINRFNSVGELAIHKWWFPMASDSRDSSDAVQEFLDRAPSEMPDLGDPLSEDYDDPLLDRERIELDESESSE